MKGKLDFNKIVYGTIGVLIVVIVGATVISGISSMNQTKINNELSGQSEMVYKGGKYEAKYSQIEEGNLPQESDLVSLGLENVKQTSKINDQFNLSTYDVYEGGIRYSYLSNAVTSGERLYIYAKKMSLDEYSNMLPKAKNKSDTIEGVNVVFNDRMVYFAPDKASVPENISENEAKGNVVVRLGENTNELLPMQQFMWYDNGIGYTLESISREYTYNDMSEILSDFFDAVK